MDNSWRFLLAGFSSWAPRGGDAFGPATCHRIPNKSAAYIPSIY